jgi:hypothetical protein
MITVETETRPKNHSTLRIPSREEFHRHYGGALYESDFCTYHPVSFGINKGSVIADKIMSDLYRERKRYLDTKRAKERQCK